MSLLFKFILSAKLINSLWDSDILLFSEFINIVSILYYASIELIRLLHTFLVIYFAWYKEYIIWPISFNKFSDVLPYCICARATGNLRSICLGVIILSHFPCVDFNGNIPLLQVIRVNSWPL